LILKEGLAELRMIYLMRMTELNAHAYLIPSLLNWRRDFFRLKRKFLDDQLRRGLRGPW
jgi:hypothetical protein